MQCVICIRCWKFSRELYTEIDQVGESKAVLTGVI